MQECHTGMKKLIQTKSVVNELEVKLILIVISGLQRHYDLPTLIATLDIYYFISIDFYTT
jgi:hypothetical protein